jgi:hypothetical protein
MWLKFSKDYYKSQKLIVYYKKLLCKSILKLWQFYKSSLKSFLNLDPGTKKGEYSNYASCIYFKTSIYWWGLNGITKYLSSWKEEGVGHYSPAFDLHWVRLIYSSRAYFQGRIIRPSTIRRFQCNGVRKLGLKTSSSCVFVWGLEFVFEFSWIERNSSPSLLGRGLKQQFAGRMRPANLIYAALEN